MKKALTNIFFNLLKRQDGAALPAVLAMFAVGSLLLVPSINYVATNLNAGAMTEKEFKGMLAADAGVEDALWKIKNEYADFLDPYTITGINGMSVNIDIDENDTIAGEIVRQGGKADNFVVLSSVNETQISENTSIYSYMLSATNNGTGYLSVEMILIDFPPGLEYEDGSTTSNITKPLDAEPSNVNGSSETGITVVWDNVPGPGQLPKIWVGETKYHYFELSGLPCIEGVEGHGFVAASREDVGDVWIGDVVPYSIEAEARDDSGEVIAAVRAGAWKGGGLEISCWQVTR